MCLNNTQIYKFTRLFLNKNSKKIHLRLTKCFQQNVKKDSFYQSKDQPFREEIVLSEIKFLVLENFPIRSTNFELNN